jgi:aminoglycoside 3-N-acetyltransferase
LAEYAGNHAKGETAHQRLHCGDLKVGANSPLTTPTTMGSIPEAFRTFPGTCRSNHPLVSVCANDRHALEFCEGRGTPFEKLYELDAQTLLLGVGLNRCTSLHYAESLVSARRTTVSRFPIIQNGERIWVENLDMASDNGVHFPVIGNRFVTAGGICAGRVGTADALLFATRALVDFAKSYFLRTLVSD